MINFRICIIYEVTAFTSGTQPEVLGREGRILKEEQYKEITPQNQLLPTLKLNFQIKYLFLRFGLSVLLAISKTSLQYDTGIGASLPIYVVLHILICY